MSLTKAVDQTAGNIQRQPVKEMMGRVQVHGPRVSPVRVGERHGVPLPHFTASFVLGGSAFRSWPTQFTSWRLWFSLDGRQQAARMASWPAQLPVSGRGLSPAGNREPGRSRRESFPPGGVQGQRPWPPEATPPRRPIGIHDAAGFALRHLSI